MQSPKLSCLHPLLQDNETALKGLEKMDIKTPEQFFSAEDEKLVNATGFRLQDIGTIKKDLMVLNPEIISQEETYKHYLTYHPEEKLATGIGSLDQLLDGGLLIGGITELIGFEGSGKTFICTTMVVNVALNYKAHSLYLDTKQDWSSTRALVMMQQRGVTDDTKGKMLASVKVQRVFNPAEFKAALLYLANKWQGDDSVKLLVIDSFPSIAYQYESFDSMRNFLKSCANLLRLIAIKHRLAIVTTNILFEKPDKPWEFRFGLTEIWKKVPSKRIMVGRLKSLAGGWLTTNDEEMNDPMRRICVVESLMDQKTAQLHFKAIKITGKGVE